MRDDNSAGMALQRAMFGTIKFGLKMIVRAGFAISKAIKNRKKENDQVTK